jgi:hypothetical protein
MTTNELLLVAGIAATAGTAALDDVLPYGLLELRRAWRYGLGALVVVGLASVALAVVLHFKLPAPPAQPDPACKGWDCETFDQAKWGP